MDSQLPEPKLLAVGKIFEAQFRKRFLATGGSSDNVEVARHCRVVRSRGTERSQMLDSFGKPTSEAEESVSLQTVRPIVIRGFGSVDLMVFYVDDDGAQCHVVVEIKNTDWNAIPRSRVVRTLGT